MKKRSASSSSRSRSSSVSTGRRSGTLTASRSRTPKPARSARPRTAQISRTAKVTIDHDQIRRWAEARGGTPAIVKKTHRRNEPEGILRIDFPGFTGQNTLEHVSWDEWFRIFDKHNLAFLYQDRKADGELSTFNKLVCRSELL